MDFKGGEIEFKNIKYSYLKDEKNSETLLSGLNMRIPKGTHTAIVGPSGFGKSTIFNMVFWLLDPDEGEVLIDGQNIKDLKFDSFW